jgi:DNA polymerase III delta prime subunit
LPNRPILRDRGGRLGGRAMKNVIVYLVGPPGVGKHTVGSLVAERLAAKLLDNHFWANPILEVVEPDGRPLPAGVWDRTNDVLSAVLETVARFGPEGRNYVFTHAVSDPGGHPVDWVIAGKILWAAERRRASLLVVRLACGEAQLRERIVTEERRRRFKTTDPEQARSLASLAPFPIDHHWILDLDTSGLTPTDTADRIHDELRARLDE